MTFGEVWEDGQEEDRVVDVHHEREQVWCLASRAPLYSFVFVHHQIFSDAKHQCGEKGPWQHNNTSNIQLSSPISHNVRQATKQGDYDGRGQQTASPMLTAIMSGGVGISGRELSTQLINSLEQANHSFS